MITSLYTAPPAIPEFGLGLIKKGRRHLKLLLLTLSLVVVCRPLSAQVVHFNNISQEQGLRNGNVRAIVKDHQGFIWIGTEDGLHRYDGYGMKVYRSMKEDSTTLASNFILCLFEDSHKNLWIGTLDGGLCAYDRKLDRFVRQRLPLRSDSSSNVFIRSITEGSDHFLYVGSDHLVHAKVSELAAMKFSRVSLPTDSLIDSGIRITSIVQGNDNELLVSINTHGLFVYDTKLQKSYPHKINSLEKNIQSLYFDREKNRLWIGSWKSGLLVYDVAQDIHRRIEAGSNSSSLRNNFIAAITGDHSGNTWIATDKGLSFISGMEDPFHESCEVLTYQADEQDQSNVKGVIFKSLYVDDQDKLWIGAYYEGLCLYDHSAMNFGTFKIRASNKVAVDRNVNALAEDNAGNFWVGLDGGGLYRMAAKEGIVNANTSSITSTVDINKIKALAVDGRQNVWIGTWGNGLNVLDVHTGNVRHINSSEIGSEVISLDVDRSGNLWVGTFDTGLLSLSPGNLSIKKVYGTKSNSNLVERVNAILCDSVGRVWVGKEVGGLNVLEPGQTRYKPVDTQHLDQSTSINTIFQDKHGNLWLGVPAIGLVHYNPNTRQSQGYGENAGLNNGMIYSILEDKEGRLWISHNGGISLFDHAREHFVNFTKNGLGVAQFNRNCAVVTKKGEYVFGNIRGLTYFHPEAFTDLASDAPTVLTDFLVDGVDQKSTTNFLSENITVAHDVTLPHNKGSFKIEFATLSFSQTDQIDYYYMLEGFEDAWQYSGKRRLAAYTNLPPGEYTFRVKGLYTPLTSDFSEAQLKISITPAWWQTRAFKIGALLLLATLIFIFHRLRVRFLLRHRALLEMEVASRTRELNETVEEVNQINNTLQAQGLEISEKSNEILTQNEELQAQNDYIAEQHELLAAAQLKLQEINHGLENTVAERTETLQHTIDNLNKVVFELDRFVYSASHDLSAPLKSVLGLVNIIEMEPDPQNVKGYVRHIRETVLKLETVIKSMVEYAHNTHAAVKNETIDLHDVVDEVYKELAFTPEAAVVKYFNHIPNHVAIQSDRTRLKVVLSNLTSNALKYIDKTKDVSWVKFEVEVKGGIVQIMISDNGIGIKDEYLGKVFNMYFRATETSKGSGLGLFIVKETLNKIGGNISVESAIGVGTSFRITLS